MIGNVNTGLDEFKRGLKNISRKNMVPQLAGHSIDVLLAENPKEVQRVGKGESGQTSFNHGSVKSRKGESGIVSVKIHMSPYNKNANQTATVKCLLGSTISELHAEVCDRRGYDPKEYSLIISESSTIEIPKLQTLAELNVTELYLFKKGKPKEIITPKQQGAIFIKVHQYSTKEILQTSTLQMQLSMTMSEVFNAICTKKKYDPSEHVFRMADNKTDVPLQWNLETIGTSEFCVTKIENEPEFKMQFQSRNSKSHSDILATKHEIPGSHKRQTSNAKPAMQSMSQMADQSPANSARSSLIALFSQINTKVRPRSGICEENEGVSSPLSARHPNIDPQRPRFLPGLPVEVDGGRKISDSDSEYKSIRKIFNGRSNPELLNDKPVEFGSKHFK